MKSCKTPKKTGDRFIPCGTMDLELGQYLLKENSNPNLLGEGMLSPRKETYKECVAESLFDGKLQKGAKVLAFKAKAPLPKDSTQNPHKVLYSSNHQQSCKVAASKPARHIPKNPEKILDAPNIGNDWYLNLIDWGSSNVLAIALSNTCYLWDASSGHITEFMSVNQETNQITSVNWAQDGQYLGKSSKHFFEKS